ncbi:thermonuclease family protein [Gulosibacter chungangensis]|uniref:Thermonuclease family protein n=1 Tax=Gulosibacter chungangensis TaxID=979746 RepID=A0A7J5BG78_9MICO|nr:thermonuclease family protein [Gulosibacter chungangensis]KAB1645291.1 thermonuclease family protein [Gulosibacter chungangensis]
MNHWKARAIAASLAVALAFGLAGCEPRSTLTSTSTLDVATETPTSTPASETATLAPTEAASAPESQDTASATETPDTFTVVSITDGDTIVTSAGKVRLIGIDTPEIGQCGYTEASAAISALLKPGDTVTLTLPDGQSDTDRYDRLLRYVYTESGEDVGQLQIEAGHAVARYDSRDGYPAHPHEDAYHAAQLATQDASGTVIPVGCEPAVEMEPAPATDSWWLEYSSCSKLKKNTVGHPKGPFSRDDAAEAEIYQWFAYGTGHRGDGDGDGLACE